MAGHSKFANIKHRKARVDAKKGRAFSKHAKLIMSAARVGGGGDPESNARLALAIEKARADNMPKDNIERAIKKGTGELDGGQAFEEIRYEGYGPGGTAVMVDALTDNRNRTAPEIRSIFEKCGGNLGETNSVAWGFDSRALVVVRAAGKGQDEDAVTEAALDAGALDLQREEDEFHIYAEPTGLHALRKRMTEAGFEVVRAELTVLPKTSVTLGREDARRMLHLLDELEDNDDVQATWSNVDIPDDLLRELAED